MSKDKATTNLFDIGLIPKDSKINTRVEPFGKGNSVKYRLYNSYDPIKKKFYLKDTYVPNTDTIIDPDTGVSYDIGYVTGRAAGGAPIFGEIWFNSNSLCVLMVRGDRVKDKNLYEYMERSNFNASNPYRDPSAPIIFERVEAGTDGDIIRKKRKDKQLAFNMLDEMSDKEITSFLKANNLPVGPTESSRREYVEDYLEENGPETFLKSSSSGAAVANTMVTTIEELKKKEIIAYNSKSRTWTTQDGNLVHGVNKGGDPVGELARFLASKKGAEVLSSLNEKLKEGE